MTRKSVRELAQEAEARAAVAEEMLRSVRESLEAYSAAYKRFRQVPPDLGTIDGLAAGLREFLKEPPLPDLHELAQSHGLKVALGLEPMEGLEAPSPTCHLKG